MAIPFRGPRYARPFIFALLALSMMAIARAEDAPQPPQQHPAATPSAQKSGATGEHGGATPNAPAAPEQHRLPLDSTTKQTLVLPGRTLAFTATAGSIRLFNDKREPQADIVYTAYQLDGADPTTRPVTFFFNGGPGAPPALPPLRKPRPRRPALNTHGPLSSPPPHPPTHTRSR